MASLLQLGNYLKSEKEVCGLLAGFSENLLAPARESAESGELQVLAHELACQQHRADLQELELARLRRLEE